MDRLKRAFTGKPEQEREVTNMAESNEAKNAAQQQNAQSQRAAEKPEERDPELARQAAVREAAEADKVPEPADKQKARAFDEAMQRRASSDESGGNYTRVKINPAIGVDKVIFPQYPTGREKGTQRVFTRPEALASAEWRELEGHPFNANPDGEPLIVAVTSGGGE